MFSGSDYPGHPVCISLRSIFVHIRLSRMRTCRSSALVQSRHPQPLAGIEFELIPGEVSYFAAFSAVSRVRDAAIHARMRALHDSYDVQARSTFLRKV